MMADLNLQPGAPRAIESGCTCPVLDNAHGAGIPDPETGKTLFWVNEGCPLHGAQEARRT